MTPKHWGELDDGRGNRLHWPGGPDGFPFKGHAPGLLTEDEYSALRTSYDPGFAILRLPDQASQWCDIVSKLDNGTWLRRREEWHKDPDKDEWTVLLVWLEPYCTKPPSGMRRDDVQAVSLRRRS